MSRAYWFKRAQENDARNAKYENDGILKVQKAFAEAEKEIQSLIDKFYLKYSEDGVIDLAATRKHLTPKELETYRREISRLAKETSTLEEQRRLEALKARVHVSRYEALLEEIRYQAEELGVKTDRAIEGALTKIFEEQTSHQRYNTEQLFGWGVNFEGLSKDQINTLVHTGYDKSDFSSRVWRNTDALVSQLNTLLPQQFLMGKSSQDLGAALAKAMGASRRSAETTIRTEGSHISAQADMRVYKDAGLETYEFLATLDHRTSEECQALDGMHFKLSEAVVGVNLPPIHANCRSTTLPDVDMDGYDESRLAKDEDGNYIVVQKQTYSEWKQSLATRSSAPRGLDGATVNWTMFDGFRDRKELLAWAQEKYVTGEIPDDVLKASNDPDLLKKIRANAQTTFNENAARYLEANKKYWSSHGLPFAELVKLKENMDRYANKMVLYANKLKVIDERAWEKLATPATAETTIPSLKFVATSAKDMREDLKSNYSVDLSELSDDHVEYVYEAVKKMYDAEPEITEAGLKKLPRVHYFTGEQQKKNPNTYAWVWTRDSRMQLSKKYFNDEMLTALRTSYESDVRTHWHPTGTDYYGLFIHEFGHVVDNTYTQMDRWVNFSMSNIQERAWNKAKKSGDYVDKTEWKDSISSYATKNNAETWAEAWCDYIQNGANATEASKLVVAEFKKEIEKKYGGNEE